MIDYNIFYMILDYIKENKLSLMLTLLIFSILTAVFASIVPVQINLTPDEVLADEGSLLDFEADIRVQSSQRLETRELLVTIEDKSNSDKIICTFDLNSNPIECNENITIKKVRGNNLLGFGYGYSYDGGYGYGNDDVGYGYGNDDGGYGYGNDDGIFGYNYGYNYGYDYGYNYGYFSNTVYRIDWQTPDVNEDKEYELVFSLDGKIGSNSGVFSSNPSLIYLNNMDDNGDGSSQGSNSNANRILNSKIVEAIKNATGINISEINGDSAIDFKDLFNDSNITEYNFSDSELKFINELINGSGNFTNFGNITDINNSDSGLDFTGNIIGNLPTIVGAIIGLIIMGIIIFIIVK